MLKNFSSPILARIKCYCHRSKDCTEKKMYSEKEARKWKQRRICCFAEHGEISWHDDNTHTEWPGKPEIINDQYKYSLGYFNDLQITRKFTWPSIPKLSRTDDTSFLKWQVLFSSHMILSLVGKSLEVSPNLKLLTGASSESKRLQGHVSSKENFQFV